MGEIKVKKNSSIRLATIADVYEITELHCASFSSEEHVQVMLGKQYVYATYKWLITSNQSYVLVAEDNGKISGLIAVCDGPFTRPMFIACIPAFLSSLLKNPTLILEKKLWVRLIRRPDIHKKSNKITNIPGFAQMTIGAVDESIRGHGIFPSLVESTKKYSFERGSRAIRAGIYKKNKPSRKVFIKGNWIETPELETLDTVFYVTYLDAGFAKEIGLLIINKENS